MKTKMTKKLVVSSLAVAMGAALVGSISGTVAWYQYSTRVTAQLSGTSAGTSRNLQISSNADVVANSQEAREHSSWDYNFKPAAKNNMAPSSVILDGGIAVEQVAHPVYQYFNNWHVASENDVFAFDLYLQSLKEGNAREALPVYLTAFEIKDNAGNDLNNVIAEALRIEIVPYTYDGSAWTKGTSRLLSKTAGTTEIADYLNLNNRAGGTNLAMDTDGFTADDSEGLAKEYKATVYAKELAVGADGTGWFTNPDLAVGHEAPASIATAGTYYKAGNSADSYDTLAASSILANDTDPYHFTNTTYPLVSTSATYAVKLSVRIWIEGWQKGAAVEHANLAANTPLIGYYNDEDCAAEHAEALSVSGSYTTEDLAAGKFTDAGLTTPATAGENGKLATAGTYYTKNVADGSTNYYEKGYIWNDNTIGTGFQLNMRFGCEAAE